MMLCSAWMANHWYLSAGIKGSLYDNDIWEMERGVPMYLSGYGGLMEDGHNYTFALDSDVPQPYFNVLWATAELSFDVSERRRAPPMRLLLPYSLTTSCRKLTRDLLIL